jgi:hypothetical protein
MDENRNPWTILEQRAAYDNKWIAVTEYAVINPRGGKGIYGKVHFKNLAIVFCRSTNKATPGWSDSIDLLWMLIAGRYPRVGEIRPPRR